MALDGCGVVSKVLLIIINIGFSVMGAVLVGLGLWLRFSDDTRAIFDIQELNSSAFVTGVNVLIVFGAVLLIMSLFGHYGACKESRVALALFSVFVIIMGMGEIAAGVNAFSDSDEVGKKFTELYGELYALYVKSDNPAIAATLTFIHKLLNCCGLTGIPIIEIVQKTCPETQSIFETLPSCPKEIPSFYDSWVSQMMILFVATGFVLIVAFICCIVLRVKIRQSLVPQYVILANSPPTVVTPLLYPQLVSSTPRGVQVVNTPVPQA